VVETLNNFSAISYVKLIQNGLSFTEQNRIYFFENWSGNGSIKGAHD
jgi:hypothetical protein